MYYYCLLQMRCRAESLVWLSDADFIGGGLDLVKLSC